MSLVIRVHRSFPCAQAWDEAIANSGSGASSRASIVAIVWVINSRIASRTVAAMFTYFGSWRAPPTIARTGSSGVSQAAAPAEIHNIAGRILYHPQDA